MQNFMLPSHTRNEPDGLLSTSPFICTNLNIPRKGRLDRCGGTKELSFSRCRNLRSTFITSAQSYFGDRVKMLSRQKEMGVTVYPKFSVSMNLKKYREKYRRLDNGKQMQEVQESLVGRYCSYPDTDCSVILDSYLNLHTVYYVRREDYEQTEVQKLYCSTICMVEVRQSKSRQRQGMDFNKLYVSLFFSMHTKAFNRLALRYSHEFWHCEAWRYRWCDWLPRKGNSGELIIYPKLLEVLSPCLHLMPNLPRELTKFSPGSPRDPHKYILKQEARARNRFLDLILNKDVRQIFEIRSKIISYLRKFLDDLDFQEDYFLKDLLLCFHVETPILNSIPGVGAGYPFVTEYKNMKLYLRVAPEVNLKKLLVGGLDRVYEIGKQFRNEGVDPTHTLEFTSCELYMTYADYEDMMELTEQLLSVGTIVCTWLVKELTGSFIIKCPSNGLDKEPIDIDFTPPFR
ncbi:hypothetical protein V2J09_022643 [Rumex salicifolius]